MDPNKEDDGKDYPSSEKLSKLLHSSSNLTEKMVCNGDIAVEKSLDSFSLLVGEDVRSHDSNTSYITTVGKNLNAFLSNSAQPSRRQTQADEKLGSSGKRLNNGRGSHNKI